MDIQENVLDKLINHLEELRPLNWTNSESEIAEYNMFVACMHIVKIYKKEYIQDIMKHECVLCEEILDIIDEQYNKLKDKEGMETLATNLKGIIGYIPDRKKLEYEIGKMVDEENLRFESEEE